ncbi:ATP-binding protein [Bacillus sp. T33-2]|uniref:ATP-binding protein n=1 Tax=Bacillus sp. T33-2 TaxID=2054168 RepID=UPI0035B53183
MGTGLGLMVAFSIIRASKGTVQVNSGPGKGTEFVVTFPEANKDSAQTNEKRTG